MTNEEQEEVVRRRREFRMQRRFRILKKLMLDKALYVMRYGENHDQMDLIKKILPSYIPRVVQGGGEESDPISVVIKTAVT